MVPKRFCPEVDDISIPLFLIAHKPTFGKDESTPAMAENTQFC